MDNKALQEIQQKLQATPIPDIKEIIMYTEDNRVIQMNNAKTSASLPNKIWTFQGKTIKSKVQDNLVEHMANLPPKQLEQLKKEIVAQNQN